MFTYICTVYDLIKCFHVFMWNYVVDLRVVLSLCFTWLHFI